MLCETLATERELREVLRREGLNIPGADGKSTLLDLVLWVLGDYARLVPSETLMEARGDRHPTEIANLMGTRLAVSSELEEGQHWA